MTTPLPRPEPDEYAAFYAGYVAAVPRDADLLALLEAQPVELRRCLEPLDDAAVLVHHPPYTWSLKQVIGHLNDAERVFAYRSLRFARGDVTPLPGFDENAYMAAAPFDRVPMGDLLDEFESLRRSTVLLVRSFDEAAWCRWGVASEARVTVRALGFILAGHVAHHGAIVKRRLNQIL